MDSEMGYSTHHCLLLTLDKWKLAFDNNQVLLKDLLKSFDYLIHDLLIAKLYSYGLRLTFLRLPSDYLSSRKQRIKVENVFSKRQNFKTGVATPMKLKYRLCNQISERTIYTTFKLV